MTRKHCLPNDPCIVFRRLEGLAMTDQSARFVSAGTKRLQVTRNGRSIVDCKIICEHSQIRDDIFIKSGCSPAAVQASCWAELFVVRLVRPAPRCTAGDNTQFGFVLWERRRPPKPPVWVRVLAKPPGQQCPNSGGASGTRPACNAGATGYGGSNPSSPTLVSVAIHESETWHEWLIAPVSKTGREGTPS